MANIRINRQLLLGTYPLTFFVVVLVVVLTILGGTPASCRFGPRIEYPFAALAQHLPGAETDLVVFLTKDQRVFVGAALIPADHLMDELRAIQQRTPGRHLVLNADRGSTFRAVRNLIAAVRSAGYLRFSIVTFVGTPLEFGYGGRYRNPVRGGHLR